MLNLDLAQFKTASVSVLTTGTVAVAFLGGGVRADGCAKGARRAEEDSEGSSRVFYGNGCTTWSSSLWCVWGQGRGFEEGRGLFGAPACILTVCGKNAGRGCSCGFLKDSSHLGKRGVTEEPEKRGSGAARPPGTFYFCSLCCKECSTNGLLGLPLDFPHHNGRKILTKLPCVTNLYITHAHVNTWGEARSYKHTHRLGLHKDLAFVLGL